MEEEPNLTTTRKPGPLGIIQHSLKNEPHIQGADDKIGQFLDQDIEASANHKNVLRHSLDSCPSLVSPNVKKPSKFTKICRYRTKLVQQS